MQQQANMSETPVIVSVQTAPIRTRRRYIPVTSKHAQEFKRLGVANVVIGALCIIIQSISLGCTRYMYVSSFDGHGIWLGSQFIVTGVFGIFAGRTGRKCQVITFHVLSTISTVFALTLLCLGTVCAAFAVPNPHDDINRVKSFVAVAMEALLAILGFAEGVVAIRSSVIGCTIGACCCKCRGACCCPTDSQYQQLHNLDQPDLEQQQSFASSQQEPTFNTNQEQPAALNQHQQQIMFNPSQKLLVLNPNHQPPLFVPSQQQPFKPNQQQPMFNPNQQQLIFLSTQPNVGFYPQHQSVQYYALQPIAVLGSHQTDSSTILSGATGPGQDASPLTGLKDASLPDDNAGTSRGSGSDKDPISADDVEMLSP